MTEEGDRKRGEEEAVERHEAEPAEASEQDAPEPERPPTPRELAEASPGRVENPPQAEGERDEA